MLENRKESTLTKKSFRALEKQQSPTQEQTNFDEIVNKVNKQPILVANESSSNLQRFSENMSKISPSGQTNFNSSATPI